MWEMDAHLVFCLLAHVVLILHACDPDTQYEKDGACCKMCGPGTRMSKSNRDCQDPQCESCPVNEYQPTYTKDERCTPQPYCDPNKYLERESPPSETSRIPCRCQAGYHCASDSCLFCVQNTQCEPGSGVVSKANRTHDTVCKPCPPNTFSNESSAERQCVKHTDCGRNLQEKGTATSDAICGILSGDVAGFVVLALLILIIVVAFLVWTFALPDATKSKVQGFCTKPCGNTEKEKADDNIPQQHLINMGQEDGIPETSGPELETLAPELGAQAYSSVPVESTEEEECYPTEETGGKPFLTPPQSQMNSLVSMP